MSEEIRIENKGHVRTIIMNRPSVKNALNETLAWGLIGALEDAASDDSVWVIAITGTGDAFCSGLDLSGPGSAASPLSGQGQQLDDLGWVGRFLITIRQNCDKPVVGGINGVAVGAGLGLAMATDARIISKSARLMAGYTRIGGSPDAGLTITLPQVMGYEKALRFMMENRTVQGKEAKKLGMAGEVTADDALAERLQDYCQELCQWSPITLRLLKRGLVQSLETTDMKAQLRYELANIRRAFTSDDAKEARLAFMEKRKPVFTGK